MYFAELGRCICLVYPGKDHKWLKPIRLKPDQALALPPPCALLLAGLRWLGRVSALSLESVN
jgi:hypothetical protein